MEGIELICFELITTVGDARSSFIEAIHEAKEGNIAKAREIAAGGKKRFAEGHRIHASLIQQDAGENNISFSMLLLHAEDQLMSAETFSILCAEFIDLYEALKAKPL